MINENKNLSLTVGRDYRSNTEYEYVIFRGEAVLARQGFYETYAKAKRKGMKKAQELLMTTLFARIGTALHGEGFIPSLAAELGIDVRTVQRWASGRMFPPQPQFSLPTAM